MRSRRSAGTIGEFLGKAASSRNRYWYTLRVRLVFLASPGSCQPSMMAVSFHFPSHSLPVVCTVCYGPLPDVTRKGRVKVAQLCPSDGNCRSYQTKAFFCTEEISIVGESSFPYGHVRWTSVTIAPVTITTFLLVTKRIRWNETTVNYSTHTVVLYTDDICLSLLGPDSFRRQSLDYH